MDFTFGGDFNPEMSVTDFDAPASLGWECVGGVEQWADNTLRFELEDRGGSTHLRFRHDYAIELSDDDYGTYKYNWAITSRASGSTARALPARRFGFSPRCSEARADQHRPVPSLRWRARRAAHHRGLRHHRHSPSLASPWPTC